MLPEVQKWDNSLAIRLPKAFVADLGIGHGTMVDLAVEDGALILRPAPIPKYELKDLLAKVSDDNLHPVTDWGQPVGREEW